MDTTNVAIIGAGPIGLELAAALKRAGADYIQFDAGQIGQTISWYPRQVKFFSSPERIGIAGIPLRTPDESKATREQYLNYLRSVVEQLDLPVRTFERVTALERTADGGFLLRTRHWGEDRRCAARKVVLAIGDMHRPRLLHVPGESLDHVGHYLEEPHRYFRQRLLIVGGRNSAVEAAIRCARAGAIVSLSYRRLRFDDKSIKYWMLPEVRTLIETQGVLFYPGTVPVNIAPGSVMLARSEQAGENVPPEKGSQPIQDTRTIDADFVLIQTGYEMDTTLLRMAGAQLQGPNEAPLVNDQTMETTVPGLFVAGTAAGGTQLRYRLFIENCHVHVEKIARAITGRGDAGVFGAGAHRLIRPDDPPES